MGREEEERKEGRKEESGVPLDTRRKPRADFIFRCAAAVPEIGQLKLAKMNNGRLLPTVAASWGYVTATCDLPTDVLSGHMIHLTTTASGLRTVAKQKGHIVGHKPRLAMEILLLTSHCLRLLALNWAFQNLTLVFGTVFTLSQSPRQVGLEEGVHDFPKVSRSLLSVFSQGRLPLPFSKSESERIEVKFTSGETEPTRDLTFCLTLLDEIAKAGRISQVGLFGVLGGRSRKGNSVGEGRIQQGIVKHGDKLIAAASGFPGRRGCIPEEHETTQFRQYVWEKEGEGSSSLTVPKVYTPWVGVRTTQSQPAMTLTHQQLPGNNV
ncbi:hypothetical protein L345_12912, partial [Ophiophagus hannah]